MLKAVLFDMDGLITDTEKLLNRFWCISAKEFGFDMRPEHALAIRSMSPKYAAPHLQSIFGEDFDYYAIRVRRKQLMNDHITEHGVEAKAGLYELLDHIGERGLKCAVCTATDLERTKWYLGMLGVFDRFDDHICGDMIANGKPKPDTYLTGAARLGLDPSECIALEDSPNGIESAFRAGCIPVMIPDLSQPDEELKKKLHAVCGTLADVIPVIDSLLDK
ncbi:haloacid dehalogenase superfamily, subfamily IA, variant 3 with third motif having DD or ED [Ruminococcus sp. YE71]|uniref:HAD family hydrolase n=1 Tax=unclassified Ruminococcus TaxID=2608920 RepID=UPI00088F1698|nr:MULTISPECIES: HAD family phosphatase [unclassified Ruminococcus]SDA18396.1 haloacid dehalogenase superfamily, subfamily IA, variant 3 with third motif having DD or ED [Ruminococcus sp. YE78]SFW29994.1 haloacid dehalogenase superfamily, subfamily IA, variant 3 with third motif having DD or ED [Ruminococcus sp. YE71]